jgi:TMEM175 potassium channel family protein
MKTGRLEAFSDGVLAIIITIMVLELKVPEGSDLAALRPLVPLFLSYVLSFVYIGIYWNNHHHLMHATQEIGGGVMWANLGLLFFLSLIPVVTAWVGEYPHEPWPAALYGLVLLLAGTSYVVLERAIIAHEGPRSELARAVGRTWKEKLSPLGYVLGIGLAFVRPWLADLVYAGVAAAWIVPDPRIEKRLRAS